MTWGFFTNEAGLRTNLELCDLGADSPDSFAGFGTSCTAYEHSVVGCGSTPAYAVQDALEQLYLSEEWDAHASEPSGLDEWVDRLEEEYRKGFSHPYAEQEDGLLFYCGVRWNRQLTNSPADCCPRAV